MVVFTCNHCGESCRKPTVEKHYSTKCRGASKFVSCMDCLKDFRDQEYVAHTKCITEEEKYSGKDFVARDSKNSGAKKQEKWMDIVRCILASSEYRLSANARSAFEKLEGFENVPRKKAKFQNFAKNCQRMPVRLIEEVWKVLEQELGKMKAVPEPAAKTNGTVNKENGVTPSEANVEASNVEEVPSKKKSKKEKEAKETPALQTNGHAETSKIKAKKSKAAASTEPQSNEEESQPKKKSKKRKINENGALQVEEETPTVEKKSKKQKRDERESQVNGDEPTKKKSKKGKTAEVVETASTPAPAEVEVDEASVEVEFEWIAVLEKLVGKSSDGVALEKLKKKALKKYTSKLGLETLDEKQQKSFEKRFSKNLKKAPTIQVEGNLVKCC